jgi:hypothetical protein
VILSGSACGTTTHGSRNGGEVDVDLASWHSGSSVSLSVGQILVITDVETSRSTVLQQDFAPVGEGRDTVLRAEGPVTRVTTRQYRALAPGEAGIEAVVGEGACTGFCAPTGVAKLIVVQVHP